MKNSIKHSLVLAFLLPALCNANKIIQVEALPNSPDINSEFSLKLSFSVPDDKVSCGINIDWGDGEIQKLRIGNGLQVQPPFKLTHIYTSSGEKKIQIKGEFIAKGIKSTTGCDVNRSGSFIVQDPVLRAEKEKLENEKLAQQARLENERKAEMERQAQLIARKSKEREEYFLTPAGKKDYDNTQKILLQLVNKPLAIDCNSSEGQVTLFKGDKDRLIKRQSYTLEKPVTETEITSVEILAKDNVEITFKNSDGEIRSVAYNINLKFIQASNYPDPPIVNVCQPNSAAAKTVANELNGSAEKKRQFDRLEAEKKILEAGLPKNWKVGIQYEYYADGSCKITDTKACLKTKSEYEIACSSVNGGISKNLFSSITAQYGSGNLFENGTITESKVYWNGIFCVAYLEASGILNGNSTKQKHTAKVSGFVLNSSNKIIANYGY